MSETPDFISGENSRRNLMEVNEITRKRILEKYILDGVDIPCADGVIISPEATIGAGTRILPGTIITGRTLIGSGCVIGPQSKVESSVIGDNCEINSTQCENSTIGNYVKAGPFTHIRPNCIVSDGVHIGNFVEIKNSVIGAGTKISHLTYIGDSDVGSGVNIGCGCATANYDGTRKHRTIIGDKAFIGCDTCLVAPVKVGNGAYTAAGSVITEDVPDSTMAIARSRQTIKRKVRKYNEN